MAASRSHNNGEIHIPASYLNIGIQIAAIIFVAGIGWNTIDNIHWRMEQIESRYAKQIEELEQRQQNIITERAQDATTMRERLTRIEVTLNTITTHLEKIAGRFGNASPLRPSYLPERSNR